MGNVWAEIDALKARHERELRETTAAIEGGGGIRGYVCLDDFGRWCCRHIPRGQRAQERLTARTGPDLVAKLKEIREREKPKAKGG